MCISNLVNKYQVSLWDLMYNIVITLYNLITRLLLCQEIVTTLLPPYFLQISLTQSFHKIVTKLLLCQKVVTTLFLVNNHVTILSQDCYNFVISIWVAKNNLNSLELHTYIHIIKGCVVRR